MTSLGDCMMMLPPSPANSDSANCSTGCTSCYPFKPASNLPMSRSFEQANHQYRYPYPPRSFTGFPAAFHQPQYLHQVPHYLPMDHTRHCPPLPQAHSFGFDQYQPASYSSVPTSSHSALEDHRNVTNEVYARAEEPEKPQGGVSEYLDYDMKLMARFVTHCVTYLFIFARTPGLANVDIIAELKTACPSACDPTFGDWVHSVLSSTRLPRPTIMYALHYMAIRLRDSSNDLRLGSDASLRSYLTTALLLGSKFNDDNTFTNKSWVTVTNIDVGEINALELEWLKAFGYNLNYSPYDSSRLGAWYSLFKHYLDRSTAPSTPVESVAPRVSTTLWNQYPTAPGALPSPPMSASTGSPPCRVLLQTPGSGSWGPSSSVSDLPHFWGSADGSSSVPSPASSVYIPDPVTPDRTRPAVMNSWSPPLSRDVSHPEDPFSVARFAFNRFPLQSQADPCGRHGPFDMIHHPPALPMARAW